MTWERSESLAIAAGALKPQGMAENIAAGVKKNENWFFQWSQTPRAQQIAWLSDEAILNGVAPGDLRKQVG